MIPLLCASSRCRIPGRHTPACQDTPDRPCGGCLTALAADGLRLCQRDADRISINAVTAAELWSELALMLAGAGASLGIRRSSDAVGINLNIPVAEHRATIRHTLISWTLLIAETRGVTIPWRWQVLNLPAGVYGPPNRVRTVNHTTAALGKFLADHSSWLAAQPFAGDVADELAELVSRGRALRQPSGTRVVEIGPCPQKIGEEGGQTNCPGMLRALLRQEASLLPSAVQCDADEEHTWSSSQWTKLGRVMRETA